MKNDGGPAFPSMSLSDSSVPNLACKASGMSLRDYFAAKIVASLATSTFYSTSGWPKNVAEDAYKMADAMLKERKKYRLTAPMSPTGRHPKC